MEFGNVDMSWTATTMALVPAYLFDFSHDWDNTPVIM
jgi:hypothetical protein